MTKLEMKKQKEEMDNEVIKLYKQGYRIDDIAEMLDLSDCSVNTIIAAHKKMYGDIKREPIKRKERYTAPVEEKMESLEGCKFAEDNRRVYKVVVNGKKYIDFTDMVAGL